MRFERLKPYIVEFNKNGIIKYKIYPPNCVIKSNY